LEGNTLLLELGIYERGKFGINLVRLSYALGSYGNTGLSEA